MIVLWAHSNSQPNFGLEFKGRSRPLLLRIATVHANSHTTSCIKRVRKEIKLTMTGKIIIATALPGFYDLGHSVIPTFLFRNRFYLQWATHCLKMNKNWAREVKKIQDFCPRHIESSHLATSRCVKLWSLNSFSLRNTASLLYSLNRST